MHYAEIILYRHFIWLRFTQGLFHNKKNTTGKENKAFNQNKSIHASITTCISTIMQFDKQLYYVLHTICYHLHFLSQKYLNRLFLLSIQICIFFDIEKWKWKNWN